MGDLACRGGPPPPAPPRAPRGRGELQLRATHETPPSLNTLSREAGEGTRSQARGGGAAGFEDARFFPPYTRARCAASERKNPSPSVDPSNGSMARSGCGIIPSTLPPALMIPAMLRAEPLGLASGDTSPSSLQ